MKKLVNGVIIFISGLFGRRRVMHNIQLSGAEYDLLVVMLTKEIEETRVEFHHTKSHEYKQYLKEREDILKEMLAKIE